MMLKALIVEQLDADGSLRTFRMEPSPEGREIVVAFADEYDEARAGPFHFLDSADAIISGLKRVLPTAAFGKLETVTSTGGITSTILKQSGRVYRPKETGSRMTRFRYLNLGFHRTCRFATLIGSERNTVGQSGETTPGGDMLFTWNAVRPEADSTL